ncbi:zinc finger protein 809-like [Belonocnema kinseyi]|uniref:zinc finger protein 809-like n=1 Tax=Belonocnema kinseyi TaxID=2817044 RepID=UPI00143DEA4F|nr:zinc finger protein 809-like [Belonocnema kinseyi]
MKIGKGQMYALVTDRKNSKIHSRKSTVRPEGGIFSSTDISYAETSTVIEDDNDESLDIKKEIMEDQETSSKEVSGQTGKLNSNWKKTRIMSTGECEAYILQHQKEQYSALFENIEADFTYTIDDSNDETLEIKEEIIEIEYTIDETLEIKEEITEAQETAGQKHYKKYESILDAVDEKETDNFSPKQKQPAHNSPKIKASEQELETKYKCEQCARCYKWKKHLNYHIKYECGVRLPFICKFCGNLYKRKNSMNAHIRRVHHKINLKKSGLIHKCDECSRSYNWQSGLCRHKRAEHAPLFTQFTCNSCGFKTKRKGRLSAHISLRHLEEF